MDFELLSSAIRKEIGHLARSATPEDESWMRLRNLLLSMADSLRFQAGETRPPIKLERMKEMRRIASEISFELPDGPDAVLSPGREGFALRQKAGQSVARHRFNTAHEIGHTFFYDINRTPPRRLLTGGSQARSRTSKASFRDKEEEICSVFARALLLPQHLLLEEMRRVPDDKLVFFLRVARTYAVSFEVVVRRILIDLTAMRNTIVMLRSAAKRDDGYDVRSIKGRQLANYTRVREAALITKAGDIMKREGSPCDGLNEIAEMVAGDVNMSSRAWNNGRQVVVVLCFREDAGSTLILNPHYTRRMAEAELH